MKKFTLFIIAFICLNHSNAQDKLPSIFLVQNDRVVYTDIIQLPGTSEEELYKRARRWLAYNCEMIGLDDKDILVAKISLPVKYHEFLGRYDVFYLNGNITIQIKEARYRYLVSDLKIKLVEVYNGESLFTIFPIEEYKFLKEKDITKADVRTKDMIASLRQMMENPVEDSW
ncbi:MAG: hypothetical protein U0W24_17510 [Bacteroidales bacterium]